MPQVTAESEVGAIRVAIGASVTLVDSTLRSFGDVKADGIIFCDGPPALLEAAGSGMVLRGNLACQLRVTGQARIAPFAANGQQCGNGALCVTRDLVVTGVGADLDVGPIGGSVVANLVVDPGATLTMREPGSLSLEGSATFNGASTEGRLTAGTLEVGSLFAQSDPQSFSASGTHTVRVGREVSMSDPGPDRQHFQDLSFGGDTVLVTDVQVNGTFQTTCGCGQTISGNGHILRVGIVNASASTFSDLQLVVENGATSSLAFVIFSNQDPTLTQLRILQAGPNTRLSGISFETRPTMGLYLEIEGAGEVRVVPNSHPNHGSPKALASPALTLLWGNPADDTDTDGLTDADELAHPCSDPLQPDTDFDGLLDGSDPEICP